jgi:hypothetical protein
LDNILNNRTPNSPVPSTPAPSDALPASVSSFPHHSHLKNIASHDVGNHEVITLPPIHTLNTAPVPGILKPHSKLISVTNPKNTSPIFPTKKRKLDFYTIFSEIKTGKRTEDIEFMDIEGQPPNSVKSYSQLFLTI